MRTALLIRSTSTTPTRPAPKFSYDPAGAAAAGRYVVRFNCEWSEMLAPGRCDVSIELSELA